MVTAKEFVALGIREKTREVQLVCKPRGDAAPTAIVDVIKLARESIEMERMNATMSNRQTNFKAELVEIRAAGRTMRGQITAG